MNTKIVLETVSSAVQLHFWVFECGGLFSALTGAFKDPSTTRIHDLPGRAVALRRPAHIV